MFKVKVRNSKTDTNYESEIMSEAQADEWLNSRLKSGVWGDVADLEIVKENMTQELADKESKKQEKKNRLVAMHALVGKNLSNAEIQQAIQALIKETVGD